MPLTLAEEVEELAARTERARAAFLGLGLGSGEILELVRPAGRCMWLAIGGRCGVACASLVAAARRAASAPR